MESISSHEGKQNAHTKRQAAVGKDALWQASQSYIHMHSEHC